MGDQKAAHRLLARIAHALGDNGPDRPRTSADVPLALATIREAMGGPGHPRPTNQPGDNSDITVTPGVSAFTGHGYVTLTWGEQGGQLTIRETRAHALGLLRAAEAAEFDAAMWAFAKAHLKVDDAGAAAILVALREYRIAESGEPEGAV